MILNSESDDDMSNEEMIRMQMAMSAMQDKDMIQRISCEVPAE